MMSASKAPLNLRAALRGLQLVSACQILETWRAYQSRWALRVRLTIAPGKGGLVPASTDWYIVADERYPAGDLRLFPAKRGCFTVTFQHQLHNDEGDPELPWRAGNLCVSRQGYLLGRHGAPTEPQDATGPNNRLLWHVESAIEWIQAAAEGRLVADGDPFELPHIRHGLPDHTVAFYEDASSLSVWQQCPVRSGRVELSPFPLRSEYLIVRRFTSMAGETVYAPRWGSRISAGPSSIQGAWIYLDSVPVVEPWRAPATWGELRRAGNGITGELAALASRLRDGNPHFLLVGFPIPRVIGGKAEEVFWNALQLPVLSRGNVSVKGFRPGGEVARWRKDVSTVLGSSAPIGWYATENWAPSTLSARGRLPMSLAELNVVILGGGALGSAVAELLARGGVTKLAIFDDETLQPGNLVRHTLLSTDLTWNKAESLADRLRKISPHVRAIGIAENFDRTPRAEIDSAEVILDCTADGQVIRDLRAYPWPSPRWFVSASMGWSAHRLFVFSSYGSSFPSEEFDRRMQPWLQREAEETAEEHFPREGMGCWHPVFPARADDVWLMAAAAIKKLEAIIATRALPPTLSVFEQQYNESGFAGVRSIPPDPFPHV